TKEKSREGRKVTEIRDTLLDRLRRLDDVLGGTLVALLEEEVFKRVRELARRLRPHVYTFQPVELCVVEARGARAVARKVAALDQLVACHHRRLAVGRPPEQREVVQQGRRQVPLRAELVDAGRTVALRELLAVVA